MCNIFDIMPVYVCVYNGMCVVCGCVYVKWIVILKINKTLVFFFEIEFVCSDYLLLLLWLFYISSNVKPISSSSFSLSSTSIIPFLGK
jgi:hypothetical protein